MSTNQEQSPKSSNRPGFPKEKSETESRLAALWSRILENKPTELSGDSDFLALGGRNATALRRLLEEVSTTFHIVLDPKLLSGNFALRKMARIIDGLLSSQEGGEASVIQLASREGVLPLSYAQQRMWFLYQLDPTSGNHLALRWRLRGLDEQVLQQALTAILARHEVLRSVFVSEEGTPRLHILEPREWDLPITNLTDLDGDAQASAVQRIAVEEFEAAFDLERGPVARAQLLRLGGDEHVLLVTMHHIATDDWSRGVFEEELDHFYRAFVSGQSPSLPPLPIQYLDYAVWQRSDEVVARLDTQIAYWKEHLSDSPDHAALSYKGNDPGQLTKVGKQLAMSLSPERSQALQALSKKNFATLHTTLMAAFRVILSRYSGQDDICIGTSIAGRTRPEFEPLIGRFANTLVFRNALQQDDAFADLLERERNVAVRADSREEAPLDRVMEALGLERTASSNPLVQVMCTHHDKAKRARPDFLGARPLEVGTAASLVGLELESWQEGDEIALGLTYNTGLFDSSAVEQMLSNLSTLIQHVCLDPEQLLSSIDLLSPEERNS